jgi:peptidoglycan/xylan/chitin deacetylase (PgdA/CDA1 family)
LGLRRIYAAFRRRSIYRRALASPARVVVLRYHAVGAPGEVGRYLDPGLSVTPERFRAQIRFLASRFLIGSPDELPALIGRGPTAPLAAILTFDDGYRDNHDVALPILREEGVQAAFFVTTGPLASRRGLWISELWRLSAALPPGPADLPEDAPRTVPAGPGERRAWRRAMTAWLSAAPAAAREAALDALAARAGVQRGEGLAESFLQPGQVRAMHHAGMTIGAHTRSHPHLDRLDPAEHAEEVSGARQDLEALLGAPVRHFAYPNPGGGGPVGAAARAAVERAGFSAAFTSIPDPMRVAPDALRLPRLGVYAGDQERVLFDVLGAAR